MLYVGIYLLANGSSVFSSFALLDWLELPAKAESLSDEAVRTMGTEDLL